MLISPIDWARIYNPSLTCNINSKRLETELVYVHCCSKSVQSGGTIIRAITVSQQIICFTISHPISGHRKNKREIISLSPHKGREQKKKKKERKWKWKYRRRFDTGECSNKIGRIHHAVNKVLSRFSSKCRKAWNKFVKYLRPRELLGLITDQSYSGQYVHNVWTRLSD